MPLALPVLFEFNACWQSALAEPVAHVESEIVVCVERSGTHLEAMVRSAALHGTLRRNEVADVVSQTGATAAIRKPAAITSQMNPRACQNQAQTVTPQEYSWS